MAKIGTSLFLDVKDPGPTSISNRGGVCSLGDAVVGEPPVPEACAIAVVVGVGVAVTTTVVVVVVGVDEAVRTEAGRQSVVTLQFLQSKLILPVVDPAVPAIPVNLPDVS